jgi:outer membrane autotransporter protein
VSGMVGYAMNSVDQTRNNVAGSGQTANADFDGDQYMAYAEFGKDYMTNGMKITPKALVNYVHADYDGYTETGTSGANLTVGSTDVDVLELGVGVSAEWDLDDGNGNAIRPSLTAEYRYDVIGDEVQTTSSFTGGGASFKTEGFDPAQSAFLLGTGIQYDISDSVSMSADYGYQFKEDYDAHNVSIRAGVKF